MRELFFEPGAFAVFCEAFTAEMELRRREYIAEGAKARREVAVVDREIGKLIQAIKDGISAMAVKDELMALEARKTSLTMALTVPPLPAMHPKMADVFRHKTMTLAAGLEHDEHRDAARQALRGFLDQIVIPPGEGLLRVVGNIGSMLAAAQGRTANSNAVGYVGCGGWLPSIPTEDQTNHSDDTKRPAGFTNRL